MNGSKGEKHKGKHDPDVAEGKCPSDPTELCKEFMKKSALEWQSWVIDANSAFKACCKEDPPEAVTAPNTDCTDVDSCHDVCKLFRDWAKDMEKYAKDFTKDVDDCFNTWEFNGKLPKVPTGRCIDCSEVCAAIRLFHVELFDWGELVRYPLNNICPQPVPERVPEPPPPPFE